MPLMMSGLIRNSRQVSDFSVPCYQIAVSGGGIATPSGVSWLGADKNIKVPAPVHLLLQAKPLINTADPDILVDILVDNHGTMTTYIDPGSIGYVEGIAIVSNNSRCTGYAPPSAQTAIRSPQGTLYTPGAGRISS